jgi:zinc protease
MQAARKYLVPERMIVVAVGDRAKIGPQLNALKLGSAEVRDSDGQLEPPGTASARSAKGK